MRNPLTDILRHASPFERIKVSGSPEQTTLRAHDKEKMLFLIGKTKQPIPEFQGEFGVGSLSTLLSLLNFPSYKSDDAQLLVHRVKTPSGDYLGEFEFRDARGGFTRFRTINPSIIDNLVVGDIPWHVSVVPTKASVKEFADLSNLLAEVDTSFGVKVEDETLFLTIGKGNNHSHTSSVAFATEVTESEYKAPNAVFNTRHLLTLLKKTEASPPAIKFSNAGAAGVTIETEHGIYDYYLRAKPAA